MQSFGTSGTLEGPPVIFPWQWYYHLPGLGFWAVVLVPLLLVKANRQWRAWLILVPLIVPIVACATLCRLLRTSAASEEVFVPFVTTLLTSWAVVWLMAHWLHSQHGLLAFGSAVLLMLGTGLLSYVSNLGFEPSNLLSLATFFSILAVGLLIPMALAGRCCRKRYSAARFMVWLLLWTPLVMVASCVLFGIGMAVYLAVTTTMSNFTHILLTMPTAAMVGAIYGLALFVLNLGFMLLAFRNSLYNERFVSVFRLRPPEGACPFAEAPINPSTETGG